MNEILNDCIFCKIVKKQIPSNIIYENENFLVFQDLYPQAPVHVLIIPKIHIKSVEEINERNCEIITNIFKEISKISSILNISSGYRIVNNCGKIAGQTVNHLHFHILGGRNMTWPPG